MICAYSVSDEFFFSFLTVSSRKRIEPLDWICALVHLRNCLVLLQIVNIHGEEREDQRNNHNQYLMFSGAGNEPNSISSKLPVEIKKPLAT